MVAMKTSEQQLVQELELLRARVAELEQLKARHKQAEEALCEWGHIFEHAGWGIVIGSADGKSIERMNPAFARMHGYTVEEITGRPITDVFAPESRAELPAQIRTAHEQGHYDFEATHIRKDGSTFPVMVHITAVKDEAGCVQCRVVHVEDITGRRQEEAMLHTNRRLAILLSTTSDLSEGLGYLVEATCQIDGIDCAGMFLVDGRTGALDLVSNRGLSPDFVKCSFHFNAGTSLARLAMAGWSIFWSAQDVVPAEQEALRRDEGLRALAMIPVLYGGKVIAMLNPGSRTRDDFDASAHHTLGAIAAQTGEFVSRVRTEEALLESLFNLQNLFDTVGDFLLILDEELHILRANPAARKRLGYSEKELAGAPLLKVYPHDRQEEAETIIADMLVEKVFACHIPVMTREGNLIPVEMRIVKGRWDNRDVYFSLFQDVTERRQTENALRESEEKYRILFESMVQGIVYQDAEGQIISANPAAARILGLTIDQMQGRTSADARWKAVHEDGSEFPGETHPAMVALSTGVEVRNVVMGVFDPRREEHRWIKIDAIPQFRANEDKPYQVYTTFDDISERKRAEKALRKSNKELQARNEELDAFGHTVAHDLKGPLGNIIGFAYLLGDRETLLSGDEVHEMAKTIEQMGLKMDSIIDELMLLAGLRRVLVRMAPLSMDGIIADILKRLSTLIEEAQAEIVCPAGWPKVVGYAPWVEEVWINYINNAVKYGGKPPHIELGATQEHDTIRFWIRDNGPGLTPEEQARLFVPFERLDQVHVSGHGLGLSIVRRIVERMGGQVSVESTGVAGEGCTFSFTLPASRDDPGGRHRASSRVESEVLT